MAPEYEDIFSSQARWILLICICLKLLTACLACNIWIITKIQSVYVHHFRSMFCGGNVYVNMGPWRICFQAVAHKLT
jgi:hypothetical protein